ncbi:MAG: 3'-to-5' exoribonuclease RNase R, partial [uncultured Solirubrobacteraceae bacterium]
GLPVVAAREVLERGAVLQPRSAVRHRPRQAAQRGRPRPGPRSRPGTGEGPDPEVAGPARRGLGRARGAHAGPRPAAAVRPGGRARRAGGGARRRAAPRPARPRHVHRRPGLGEGLRRRDLVRGARRRRVAGVDPHRRRQRLRAARLARRPRGRAARDERLRPRARRADAARGAVQRRLLARALPGARGRHGRARFRGRGGQAGAVLSLDDPLRRAAGLRAGRPRVRRRGGCAAAMGDAAGCGARGRSR